MTSKPIKPTFPILLSLLLLTAVGCTGPRHDPPAPGGDAASFDDIANSPDSAIKASAENEEGNDTTDTVDADQPTDDCIFDTSTQTDEFVRGIKEFRNYTWNDESKTATIILQNGDTLYAQRGGCYHFTYSGRLITKENRNVLDTAFWLGKGQWLAGKLFPQSDSELLDRMLKERSYDAYSRNGELFVDLHGDHDYSEFYLLVRPKGAWVEAEIAFYLD